MSWIQPNMAISRWKQGNHVLPLSRRQFIEQAESFLKTVEPRLGGDCTIEITALPFFDPFTAPSSHEEESGAYESPVKMRDLAAISPDLWDEAAAFIIAVRPRQRRPGNYSFAQAFLLSEKPHKVKCYMQYHA